MKKILFIGLSIAAVLVAGAAAFFGFEAKKETRDKKSNSSALEKARADKKKKASLVPIAEELGIDPTGMSLEDLEAEIEFVKSKADSDASEKEEIDSNKI